MDTSITLEQVTALATQLEETETARRDKLARLIQAYARILWVREPERFIARATEIRDEAGHWDSSFPPKAQVYARTSVRTIKVSGYDHEDVPTSSGFYYSWRRTTTDPGIYVDRAGCIIGADVRGTGRVGQYAAHPGDCDREIEIDWSVRPGFNVTTAELARAEEHLRALAFPASAKTLDTTDGDR